jgi:hypothetical protein
LNYASSPRCFLRRKLQDGKCISYSEVVKRPLCNIHRNGWCITRGTQPKSRMLHLESRSCNKSYPSPKAYCSTKIVGQRSFLVVLKPCLTFLSSAANRSLPTKCTPWFTSIIERIMAVLQPSTICPTRALVSLISSKYPTRCRSTSEPCHHDLTRAFIYLSCSVI